MITVIYKNLCVCINYIIVMCVKYILKTKKLECKLWRLLASEALSMTCGENNQEKINIVI